jgi:hypothetical protein
MPVGDPDALQLARDFAPEAEEILGITGIVDELNVLSEDGAAAQEAQDRMFDLGDIGSIAGALITLFMWIGQFRKGNVLKGASTHDIIHDLSIRVLNSDSLTSEAKEAPSRKKRMIALGHSRRLQTEHHVRSTLELRTLWQIGGFPSDIFHFLSDVLSVSSAGRYCQKSEKPDCFLDLHIPRFILRPFLTSVGFGGCSSSSEQCQLKYFEETIHIVEADLAKPSALFSKRCQDILFLVWAVVVGIRNRISVCRRVGYGMKLMQVIHEELIKELLTSGCGRGDMLQSQKKSARREEAENLGIKRLLPFIRLMMDGETRDNDIKWSVGSYGINIKPL